MEDNSPHDDSSRIPFISNGAELKTKLTTERRLSWLRRVEELLKTFSPAERLALYVFSILLGLSTLALLAAANKAVSVVIPAQGGSLTEGEVGPVRFINPVLTLSRADEDLTALIYSGLTRTLPDGTVIPDLASDYEVSTDGTTYTFHLRRDAVFHDNTPATSADVLFTVQLAQNPEIKSPHRADWEGVAASAPDKYTVIFKLPRAYAPFIQNTTMGVLPQHLWKNVSADEFPFSLLNTHPVGTGPYQVSDESIDATGSATRYELSSFAKFTLGAPYLKRITFLFYQNDAAMIQALNAREIDAIAGVSPETLDEIRRPDLTTMTALLPRVFGVFFNQGHSVVLADSSVRFALDTAIEKSRLVDLVLKGYGAGLDSPIPPGLMGDASRGVNASSTLVQSAFTDETIADAHAILAKGGWTYDAESNTWSKKSAKGGSASGGKQTLGFTLSTADSPQLVATANAVADAWKKLGVDVKVQVYSLSDLNTSVLRPRQYDALLFGEVVGREVDLFAFWHSSQRNDPGLNLSLYTNSKADSLLSQARSTTNAADRDKLYAQFASLVKKDDPAVFLYAPEFVYVVPKNIEGIELGALTTPAERFLNVYRWYTDTQHVWSFFTSNN
ncbi:MAG: ABC transporter substrate-binding protein [Patescibacteria group bacterium]